MQVLQSSQFAVSAQLEAYDSQATCEKQGRYSNLLHARQLQLFDLGYGCEKDSKISQHPGNRYYYSKYC